MGNPYDLSRRDTREEYPTPQSLLRRIKELEKRIQILEKYSARFE